VHVADPLELAIAAQMVALIPETVAADDAAATATAIAAPTPAAVAEPDALAVVSVIPPPP
jgi:hypothetical protein